MFYKYILEAGKVSKVTRSEDEVSLQQVVKDVEDLVPILYGSGVLEEIEYWPNGINYVRLLLQVLWISTYVGKQFKADIEHWRSWQATVGLFVYRLPLDNKSRDEFCDKLRD